MDVIICAAGLGSRLVSYTHDVIPKYLVNIDDNTGLYHIIKYWNKYAEHIYLIIHTKYVSITEFYIKSIFEPEYYDKIKIINYDTSDGTAYTLNYVINNKLPNPLSKNFLITWCDLYPIEPFYQSRFTKSGIYIFTHGNRCRYLFNENVEDVENKIINRDVEGDGNILGIYYFHNFTSFNIDDENESILNKDIVNFLSKLGPLFNYKVESIIDYGDENKINILHNEYYSNSLSISETSNTSNQPNLRCRYFNQLTVLNDDENNDANNDANDNANASDKNKPLKLFKKGITDKGKELIKNECEWFKKVPPLPFLPRIFNYYEHGYIMEYMKTYVSLYSFLKTTDNFSIKNNILQTIFNNINIVHKLEKISVSQITFFNNLKIEIFDKLYSRKKVINPLIEYFGNIIIVNGIKINTFDEVVNKCKNIIIKYYQALEKYDYSIIMGDCQFSNILINPLDIEKIVFIDPRGYFGKSKIYGPIEYDYAKILYGISGYDGFNSNNFNIKKIDIELGLLDFEICPILFDEKVIKRHFNKVHKAFMIIIWLSLAEYNKNDIWKCLCSYYHGLYLGTLL